MTLVRTLKANEGPKHTDDLVFLFSPIIRTLDGPIEDALDLTLYLSNGAGEVLYNPWGAALKHFLQIDRFAFDYLWYPATGYVLRYHPSIALLWQKHSRQTVTL